MCLLFFDTSQVFKKRQQKNILLLVYIDMHRETPRYQENKNGLCVQRGAQQSLIDLAVTVTTGLPCVSLRIIL